MGLEETGPSQSQRGSSRLETGTINEYYLFVCAFHYHLCRKCYLTFLHFLSLPVQVHTLEVFQKELNESEHLVFQAVHGLQRALQGDYRDVVNIKESSRLRLEALREAAIKVSRGAVSQRANERKLEMTVTQSHVCLCMFLSFNTPAAGLCVHLQGGAGVCGASGC